MTRSQYLPDMILTQDALPWSDIRSYTSLSSAISIIDSDEHILMIPNNVTVSDDITIPANITIQFQRGGMFTIASGKTVTFKTDPVAGRYQIFAGSGGTVEIKNPDVAWYGADGSNESQDCADALDKLFANTSDIAPGDVLGSYNIRIPPGYYNVETGVTGFVPHRGTLDINGAVLRTPNNITLLSILSGGDSFEPSPTTSVSSYYAIRNGTLLCDNAGPSIACIGMDLLYAKFPLLKNIRFEGFYTGLRMKGQNDAILDRITFYRNELSIHIPVNYYEGTTTSAGAVDGSTLVDSNLVAVVAAGRYGWAGGIVEIASGAYSGEAGFVTASYLNTSTGVMTLLSAAGYFSGQVPSGVTYRLYPAGGEIINYHIKNCGFSVPSTTANAYGILCEAKLRNFVVSECDFGGYNATIKFDNKTSGYQQSSKGIFIDKNYFESQSGAVSGAKTCVHIACSNNLPNYNVSIKNNIFAAVYPNGIKLENCRNVQIKDNLFATTAFGGTRYAIDIDSDCKNVIIGGNTFDEVEIGSGNARGVINIDCPRSEVTFLPEVRPFTFPKRVLGFSYVSKSTTSNGSAGGTTTISSYLAQAGNLYADDFWVGATITMIGGSLNLESETITDFDAATGTLTHAAFSGQVLSGQAFTIGWPLSGSSSAGVALHLKIANPVTDYPPEYYIKGAWYVLQAMDTDNNTNTREISVYADSTNFFTQDKNKLNLHGLQNNRFYSISGYTTVDPVNNSFVLSYNANSMYVNLFITALHM